MVPLLDEALARLRQTERDALVLRYFENRSLQEVAAALGLQERAAQKRVLRSLEKLRSFFLKRGIAISTAAIAGVVSANSVQTAPAGLNSLVVAAAKSSTITAPTLILAQGALKMMAWTKIKISLAAAASLAVVLAGIYFAAGQAFFFGAGALHAPGWLLSDNSLSPENGIPSGSRGHGEWLVVYNPGRLATIQAPVQSVNSGRLNFFIAEDNNGLPGNILEQFSNVLAPKVGDTNALLLYSVVRPELRAGVKYWLCAETDGTDGSFVWFYSNDLPPRGYAVERSPSAWTWIEPSETTSNAPAFHLLNYPNHIRTDWAYFCRIAVTR